MMDDFKLGETVFKDEAAAQKVADDLNHPNVQTTTFKLYFCPLIKDTCRVNCECWQPAYVTFKDTYMGKSTWRVHGCYCDNAMFGPDRNVYITNY